MRFSELPQLALLKRLGIVEDDRLFGPSKAVAAVEACYDDSFSLYLRLTRLGGHLANKHLLQSWDLELLFCAAVARWLARNRIGEVLSFVKLDYQRTCMMLSEGRNDDVLGILNDLDGRVAV